MPYYERPYLGDVVVIRGRRGALYSGVVTHNGNGWLEVRVDRKGRGGKALKSLVRRPTYTQIVEVRRNGALIWF